MGRLLLSIIGLNLMFGAIALLWLSSTYGYLTLAQAGLGQPRLSPDSVAFYVNALLMAAFVVFLGTFVDHVATGISRRIAGDSDLRDRDRAGSERRRVVLRVLWGVLAYLVVALMFAAYLRLVLVPGAFGIAMLTDAEFLQVILTWPYRVISRLGLFGLRPTF